MPTQPHEASIALTYAWWLTGDDATAEAAVVEAVRRRRSEAHEAERLRLLLRGVRDVAAPARTMCPASELALLHDGHDIDLEHAAALVEVAESDARTELAHGRLEALVQTVLEPFVHPERLGGLAVGNPPDIAHARTCTGCATALELIREGREELCALPAINAPAALLAKLQRVDTDVGRGGDGPAEGAHAAGAPPAAAPSPRDDAGVEQADQQVASEDAVAGPPDDAASPPPPGSPGAPDPDEAAADPLSADTPEGPAPDPEAPGNRHATGAAAPDEGEDAGSTAAATSGAAGDAPAPGAAVQRSRRPTVGIAAVVVGVLIVLLTAVLTTPSEPGEPADPADPAGVRDQSAASGPGSARAGADSPGAAFLEPAGGAEAVPLAGFTVTDAGVLPPGATVPATGAPAISSDDALRVAVRYAGGGEGLTLTAVPDSPGGVATALDVALTGDAGSHLFLWVAPDHGWPTGR